MKEEELRDTFFAAQLRYEWVSTIGRGGMGVVFQAKDTELDELIALKVLAPRVEADDDDLLVRFKREIQLNRRIKHPNVARIHDFGRVGSLCYVSMEFVPGVDLRRLVNREGRVAPARAVSLLRQIAMGTAAAHAQGIVHRDLKSQNVMVDERGGVSILDFGLARAMLVERRLSIDSVMVGTPHYMPPEQALGRPSDGRSDIYAIGVIGYEMLTGQLPFVGDSPVTVAMRHVNDPVPLEPILLAKLPLDLAGILLRALEKSPDDRFQSAAELESELATLGPMPEHAVATSSMTLTAQPLAATPSPFPMSPPPPPAVRQQPSPPPPARLATPDSSHSGSTFTIELDDLDSDTPPPAAPAPPAEPAPARIPSSGRRKALKNRDAVVLVAGSEYEDDHSIPNFLSAFGLSAHHIGVTGQQALERLLSSSCDVVLLDAELPDMDGFDVVRILRAQRPESQTAVLLISPRVDRNRLAFALQAGASDLIARPLDMDSLLARIWSILRTRGFVPPAWNRKLNRLLARESKTSAPAGGARRGP